MEKLFLFLLLCHVSSAVKHSFIIYITAIVPSSGIPNVPDFVGTAEVDGVLVCYCDTNNMTVEPKQDWMKKFFLRDPEHLERYKYECFKHRPIFFKARINDFKQLFNQSGGVHVLQRITGCEWHDETGEVESFNLYGYDGEDFISFDVKTSTWTALRPQAVQIKQIWDADKARAMRNEVDLTQNLPEWLKRYLNLGNSSLQRTELPSVSLLQKTSSSPVSCHASGFYPDRASLFWRNDGKELHEDVDHGEILPNHDGTFQMSVDLNLSSVTPGDWRRYECVFHLSGVKDDIVTKLDKDVIRTNEEKPSDMTIPIAAALVVLSLFFIAATGFIIYKKRKAQPPSSTPDNSPELSDRLNPETETTNALNRPYA